MYAHNFTRYFTSPLLLLRHSPTFPTKLINTCLINSWKIQLQPFVIRKSNRNYSRIPSNSTPHKYINIPRLIPSTTKSYLNYPPCIRICMINSISLTSLPIIPRTIHTSTISLQDYRRRRPTTSYYSHGYRPNPSSQSMFTNQTPWSEIGNNRPRFLIPSIIFFGLLFFSGFGGIFIIFLILGIPILFLFGLSMFAARLLSSGTLRPFTSATYHNLRRNTPGNTTINPLFFTWNRWLESMIKQSLISSLRNECSIRGLVSSLQYKVKEEDQLRSYCGRSVTLSPNPQNIMIQQVNFTGSAFGSNMLPMNGNYGISTVQLSLPVKDSHNRIVGALHVQADMQVLKESVKNTPTTTSELSPIQSIFENIKYYFSGQALKDSRQYNYETTTKMNANNTYNQYSSSSSSSNNNNQTDLEEEFEKLVQDDIHGKGPLINEIYEYTIRSVIFEWNDNNNYNKRIDVTHIWPRTLRSDTYPYNSSLFNDSTSSSSKFSTPSSSKANERTIDAEWYEKK